MEAVSAQPYATPQTATFTRQPPDGITAEEKRAELDRIVASADFPATPRKRKILAYLVDRALENPSVRRAVSARDIATCVLGREESFNPNNDPIVRIEIAKLRRDLDLYYLKSGRRNPLRIDIPRGGYDPLFMRQTPEEESARPEVATLTGDHGEDVTAELQRLLRSNDFPATRRNRRFLAYVVDRELAGKREEITAKSIAIRAFGRSGAFDPENDPIVRIEAGRLRRDLEVYYLKSGRFSPIRITIPKGRYFPVFLRQTISEDVQPQPIAADGRHTRKTQSLVQ